MTEGQSRILTTGGKAVLKMPPNFLGKAHFLRLVFTNHGFP
jgi:hypothetical protein